MRSIEEEVPFSLSYKGKEMSFEKDAKDWRNVADYAYDLIVDNMSMWGLEALSDEDFEEAVLDFEVILREDWSAIKNIFYEVFFTTEPHADEHEVYRFEKGTYTLKYINEKLSD